jgi:O-antigen/teichoic acid export membrane protein
MGIVKKEAFRTMLISYIGVALGYLNKGILFLLLLEPAQIGLVNLIVSIGTLIAQLANFGAIFTVWKFFPFFNDPSTKHRGFLPFILLIVSCGILVFTSLYLVFRDSIQAAYSDKSPWFNDYFYWVLPIGIAYVLFIVLESYLRSLYKNVVAVFAYEIVLRLVTTILLIVFALKWVSFEYFVIIHSLLYVIPTLILLVYLYRLSEWNISLSSIQISKRFRKIMFSFSSFYYFNTLGVVLVNSLDIMMIAQLVGLQETGVYATVLFLSSAIQIPYRSLVRVSSPLVSDYWKRREMDKMKELYQKVSSISLVIGLFMFLLVWLNIDFLFSFLKPEFVSGIWIFLTIMIGRLIDMYFGLNGAIFTTSKKYRYEIIFTAILIGTVYGLNLWFIPIWGAVGAAISTSIALIVFNFGRLIFVWAIYKIHPFTRNQVVVLFLFLLCILFGMLVNHYIQPRWLHLLIQTALVGFLFVLPIYLFNLEENSINYVKNGLKFVQQKTLRRKQL